MRKHVAILGIKKYQKDKPHVLAHKWFYDLGTRHNMSIKAVRKQRDMRMLGRIAGVRSAKQSVESKNTKKINHMCLHISGFMTLVHAPNMSIKAMRKQRDMRMLGRIAGVRKHVAIRGIKKYQKDKPHVLAHKWFYDLGTRHNMSIKAVR